MHRPTCNIGFDVSRSKTRWGGSKSADNFMVAVTNGAKILTFLLEKGQDMIMEDWDFKL